MSALNYSRYIRIFVVLACWGPSVVCAQTRAVYQERPEERPRPVHNVILFVSDGAGPAVFTMARDYAREVLGQPELALDALQVGSVRTHSTDNLITDSAAGATAFSAGEKTYNGAIAVDTEKRPLTTVLEAAERKGMATGLVVTCRMTHATPASFSAHVPDRNMESEIAAQQITKGIEVMFGGGRQFFLPAGAGGKRNDGRDLLKEAATSGYQVISERSQMNGIQKAPVLGLFAADHLNYDIERDEKVEPNLAEMTSKAIDLLKADPDGFFLMVEGSRIDHAEHNNDAPGALHDVLAFDAAVRAALEFARKDGNTLIISVSDHETGGLALGRNAEGDGAYTWSPQALQPVQASKEKMNMALKEGAKAPVDLLKEKYGITTLTSEEQARLDEIVTAKGDYGRFLTDVIARRAFIGWSTGGHSAVDVNLYAFGPGKEKLIGNHENIIVGKVIADVLDLDLKSKSNGEKQAASSR